MGKTEHLDGADALAALEQRLGTLGYYSKIMDRASMRLCATTPKRSRQCSGSLRASGSNLGRSG
jgi:hypothetical protein